MAIDPVTESLLTITDADRERLMRYATNWRYYRAEQYLGDLGRQYLQDQGLFKHLRLVFGYVTQTVDTDTRFSMGEELQYEAEEDFAADIHEIWERSRFQKAKYKLARFAANLGDAFLIVQDVGDGGVVVPRIIVANSEDMTLGYDPDDQTKLLWAKQSYVFLDPSDGKSKPRDWIYLPDRIERYTDERMDEGFPKPNAFGVVPVVHIPFIDVGEAYGLCSWHNVQGQLDRVNELGSFAERILLRYADPVLLGVGMHPQAERPTMQRGLQDNNIFFLPSADADMKYLEFQGNVLPHIVEMIREVGANVKDQLPELSLSQIREQTGISGYSVSLQAAELIAKIREFRGNVGDGIEWANRIALRGIRRSSAPLEEFDNRIIFEPVLPEDPEQRIRVEQGERDLGIVSRRELLRRRGLTEDEIDERLQEVERDQEATGFGLSRLAGMFGDDDDFGDDPEGGDAFGAE